MEFIGRLKFALVNVLNNRPEEEERRMKKTLNAILFAAFSLFLVDQAFADVCTTSPINCDPPVGNVVLDLNGTPVPHTYQQYTVNFVAGNAATNISFAFREDPAFLHLDDVTVTTGGGPNLLLNGGFELGGTGNTPVDWTYLNQFGAGAAGVVSGGGCHTGALCYVDGAIQAYDGITQGISTTIGSTYTITFFLNDDGGLTTFSRLSTNGNTTGTGGNGIDLIVYAGDVPTRSNVPEPSTWLLLGSGLAVWAVMTWRRSREA